MGRVKKPFTMRRDRRAVQDVGQIDTGADITTAKLDHALKLGIDPCDRRFQGETKSFDGSTIVGLRIPDVEVRVGRKTARLEVFVATTNVDSGQAVKSPNLIGHDFLQATKGQVDFRTHPPRVSEARVGRSVVGPLKPASDRASRMLMEQFSCPVKRRKRRKK